MNNPFEYTPDAACDEAFAQLTAELAELHNSDRPEDVRFCRVLDDGVMLGVLIARGSDGALHTLRAFSGQLGTDGFLRPGFVEPVLDYLAPDGYFKQKEADISRQNARIEQWERQDVARARERLREASARLEAGIEAFRERCRESKQARDARRRSGMASEAELAGMIRSSQYEKAELHRLKKRAAAELAPFEEALQRATCALKEMKQKRRADSEALQLRLFGDFKLLNARGESRSLSDILASPAMGVPPSGAGECCAPKLLQAAYLRGLTPVAIAEYWYGRPKGGEVRVHGRHYPACRGRCLPVLGWMLRGLDVEPPLGRESRTMATPEPIILYENQWFCVVEKPAGMLSVPGKGEAPSVQQWLADRYGTERPVKVAHRLDQDTSGLLIATFGQAAYKSMQSLFATGKVKKTHEAVLDGDYEERGLPASGSIELPLLADHLDRPRQRVDCLHGKVAITDYEFERVVNGRSRVIFHPLTGRTHQLRVHSASSSGLGMAITGDRLYGAGAGGVRLHLHARAIEFTFPIDGNNYKFLSPVPF